MILLAAHSLLSWRPTRGLTANPARYLCPFAAGYLPECRLCMARRSSCCRAGYWPARIRAVLHRYLTKGL